nr:chlorohydrolase family protein [Aquibacillus albus]
MRRNKVKTKIKGKFVIGYDGNDHVIIENGEVVYEEEEIVYVGHRYEGNVDSCIDAGNSVVSPGFIDLNALGDIDHDIIHIDADNAKQKNLLWSEEYYQNGYREFMTKEEEEFKSLYAYTQLILHGVTTAMPITSVLYKRWAETYEELEAAAHHAGKLGLRMYMGPSYQSGMRVVKPNGEINVYWNEEEGRKGLSRAINFVRNFDGAYNGLIKGMLAPERIETQTPDSLEQTKYYSQELGCPVRLHSAQGKFEYHEIHRRYNKTPIRFLYDLGFLGERTAIPHAHWISDYSKANIGEGNDLELLKETNTTVIHCPLIIGRHSSALETFKKYKEQGINVAMGTDTFPPDFFQNIRSATLVSRILEGNPEGSTYADFFRAATIGGAEYLGREDLGRLAPGAKADIIVVDLEGYHLGTIDDPIRTMFMSGSGRDVKMSIINGRIVMKDRKVPHVDLGEIRAKGQAYFNKMRLGYKERDYQHLTDDQLFNPSFRRMKKNEKAKL